jgi:hypothetical protein
MELPGLNPPGWAPNFCYLYYVIAIVNFIYALIGLYMLYDSVPVLAFVFAIVLVSLGFFHMMTYFWMCRGALKK